MSYEALYRWLNMRVLTAYLTVKLVSRNATNAVLSISNIVKEVNSDPGGDGLEATLGTSPTNALDRLEILDFVTGTNQAFIFKCPFSRTDGSAIRPCEKRKARFQMESRLTFHSSRTY